MAIRKIVQAGDPTLRKKCFEVTDFGEKTWQLLDDMKETLLRADGVGLAAPQVGVLRRIFIVNYNGFYCEFLNPVIVKESGRQHGVEGCLSVKGKQGSVVRPKVVKIQALDRFGKPFEITGKEFIARIFCHEYDHLDGVLYIDKADTLSEVR